MVNDQSITYESNATAAVKHIHRLVLWVSVIGFGLYSLVLAPLYTQFASDIVYQEAAITYILYYAYAAVEIAVFCIVFPATVYAVWRSGFVGSRSVWITFALATLGKYLLNFFMDCLIDGSIPSPHIFLSSDLPIILPNLLMELGQYVMVLLLTCLIIRGRKRKWHTQLLLDDGKAGDERSLAFPITKLISFKNPVQASSFAIAVFMLIARILTHLMYQLTLLVYTGKSEGALILAVDMISDVLLAAIIYFVSVLLLSSFDRREITDLAKAAREEST